MVASWFRSSPARIELEVPSVPVEHPQRPALLPISSYEVIKLLEQRDIVDLTESVLQNGSFPCYGRDSDMLWIAVRIASPQKNSILITGSPGVGKTRLYYHMARLIVENKAPPGLQGRRIFLLTNNNNAKTVLTILDQHFSKQCVLVSDEVHAIRHREAWMGMAVKDQSEELKPYIGSGKTPFIGFTDRPEGFLKDNAWRRRFHVKNLEEMSIGDAIEALKASKEFLQEKITKDHSEKFEIRVEITDEAIALAVKLSVIYLPQEFLPDKPSKILEPAAVGKVHQFMGKPVDADSIITVYSNIHEHGKPPVVQVTGEDVYRCVEQEYRVTRKEVEQQLSALESAMEYSSIPMTEPLMKYTTNLNERVRRKAVLPAYGRAEELKKVVMTLSAVEANNVILRGYAGCGKSRIGEGLAYNIVHHLVPAWLENVQVLALDLNSLIGDTKYRGELETKFKDFLKSAEKYSDHFILMIDEAHRLVGAGTSEHSPEDAANQFKELLGRGKLRVLGMTTPHEYYHLERDPAFLRRFQTQDIEPFSATQTIEVMKADKEYLEQQYSKRMKSPFKIDLSACEAAAHLGVRYWPKEYLPSSGYKILHSACAFAEVNAPAGQPVIVNDETVIDYVNYYFRKGQAKTRRLVEQDLVQLKAELHPSNQLIPLHEPLMRFTENWTNL
ncbi:MAG TPA: AAA family ATPase, partial [Rhabdochlamydiaceae bacterium]|nr:AAA family ATPase [Rhabdochlamydiaceae bacterium]